MTESKTYPYDGEDIKQCKGCGNNIFFLKTVNGRFMPVDYSDDPTKQVCHFETCRNASDFKSKKTKADETYYNKN